MCCHGDGQQGKALKPQGDTVREQRLLKDGSSGAMQGLVKGSCQRQRCPLLCPYQACPCNVLVHFLSVLLLCCLFVFDVGHFKSFIGSVTILLLFFVLFFFFFGCEACGILALRPGIERTSLSLEGGVLTLDRQGSPGSLSFLFVCLNPSRNLNGNLSPDPCLVPVLCLFP